MNAIAAFGCGLLFAVGLGLGGMTSPARVIAFLDVTGAWDPSLAFVMLGAIAVHAPLQWLVRRRSAPLLAARFALPAVQEIDAKLVGGAALFGVGWGLGGWCPGPAIVSLASGEWAVLAFVIAMAFGMLLASSLTERAAEPAQPAAPATASPR